MSNLLPVGGLPLGLVGFQRFDDVQPFSIRSHASFENIQWEMVAWLRDQLTPYLENESAAVAALQGMVNTMIADILATGNANDIVLIALLENAQSQTRAWLDARYLQTASLDTALNNMLTATGASAVRSWLDGRYAAKPKPSQPRAGTGWFHVDDFGAVGDGVTDDRAAIQNTVIAANALYQSSGARQTVYVGPKIYLVGVDAYYLANNGGQSGITSVTILDGVDLTGPGTIKTKPNAYGPGALYGVIRSQSQGLSHASITDVTIDGNKDNNPHSTQCSNILLECFTDVLVENVRSLNANGMGIMVRGTTNLAMTNVRVIKCDVEQCTAIGIQASQFSGLQILENVINGTGDNSIDVYGENGTTTSNGINFTIARNHCFNGGVGVFLETVSTGKCDGNFIEACGVGIHVNRINGEPNKLLITGNEIINCPVGVNGTGDTGGVTVRGNLIEGFTTGGCVFGGAGNVSGYYIFDNTMNAYGDQNTIPLVLFAAGTNQTANMVHMRTITKSKNRGTDTVNSGPATVNCTWTPALSPGDTVAIGQ